MLEYGRIDFSEGIDFDKTNASKECDICHYWYFLDKVSKFEPYFCNGCHDLMLIRLGFLRLVFSRRWVQFEPLSPSFIFKEELIQHQYNFMQFLNNLFRVG